MRYNNSYCFYAKMYEKEALRGFLEMQYICTEGFVLFLSYSLTHLPTLSSCRGFPSGQAIGPKQKLLPENTQHSADKLKTLFACIVVQYGNWITDGKSDVLYRDDLLLLSLLSTLLLLQLIIIIIIKHSIDKRHLQS